MPGKSLMQVQTWGWIERQRVTSCLNIGAHSGIRGASFERKMTRNGKIPFLELVAPHLELEQELVSVFRSALKTAGFVGGSMVDGFEREFAQFCGVQFCVGVASGTDALRFALIAAGVQRGDTVLTVPNTFIATTEAISQAGAGPDFVDIDERTYNMDAQKLQEYLETRCHLDRATGKLLNQSTGRPVKASVPVHLYGQTADMDRILELAERHSLIVIEDACQAHGAKYFSRTENRWKEAGSMGRAAAFSFYPGKNLGACGEAGAVTTRDGDVAASIRKLRDHGQARKYYHDIEGYNGRLDAIQAGILHAKLGHLARWNDQRRERAGTPATTVSSGTSRVTTAPAPIMARAPIVMPQSTTAPLPIEAPRLTSVGLTVQSASLCSAPVAPVARGWRSLMNMTPWPTKTSSSIVTPSQTNVCEEILQRAPTAAFF